MKIRYLTGSSTCRSCPGQGIIPFRTALIRGFFRHTFQVAGRYYYSDPQYAGGRKALVIVQ
jgi:hypothetical protein